MSRTIAAELVSQGGWGSAPARQLRAAFWVLLCVFLWVAHTTHAQAPAAPAEPEFNVREHYTKYEYRIPMRDGKRLFTAFTCRRINPSLIRS
ncbi:MAG: hypothetical protein ACK5UX_00810 [Burkholderiales bacterium]